MSRRTFGDCIGCAQPIPPPFLSFGVQRNYDDGNRITEWHDVDVRGPLADKLILEAERRERQPVDLLADIVSLVLEQDLVAAVLDE